LILLASQITDLSLSFSLGKTECGVQLARSKDIITNQIELFFNLLFVFCYLKISLSRPAKRIFTYLYSFLFGVKISLGLCCVCVSFMYYDSFLNLCYYEHIWNTFTLLINTTTAIAAVDPCHFLHSLALLTID